MPSHWSIFSKIFAKKTHPSTCFLPSSKISGPAFFQIDVLYLLTRVGPDIRLFQIDAVSAGLIRPDIRQEKTDPAQPTLLYSLIEDIRRYRDVIIIDKVPHIVNILVNWTQVNSTHHRHYMHCYRLLIGTIDRNVYNVGDLIDDDYISISTYILNALDSTHI